MHTHTNVDQLAISLNKSTAALLSSSVMCCRKLFLQQCAKVTLVLGSTWTLYFHHWEVYNIICLFLMGMRWDTHEIIWNANQYEDFSVIVAIGISYMLFLGQYSITSTI